MNVFLTGATGFVGGHVARALVREGHAVRALARRDVTLAGCDVVRGDLSDVDAFAASLAGVDAVVHVAAILDPVPSEEIALRVNRRGTMALARAAAARRVGRFVFASSTAAIAPTTAYARSKRAAEDGLVGLTATSSAIVRAPTVYGPGDRGNFLALTRAIDRRRFVVPGDGRSRFPLCHVANYARALVLCATQDAPGIHHAADEPPRALGEIARTIAAALGRRLPSVPFPIPLARAAAIALEAAGAITGRAPPLSRARLATLTTDVVLDTSSLRAIGWSPTTAFADGVTETIEWYRSEGLL